MSTDATKPLNAYESPAVIGESVEAPDAERIADILGPDSGWVARGARRCFTATVVFDLIAWFAFVMFLIDRLRGYRTYFQFAGHLPLLIAIVATLFVFTAGLVGLRSIGRMSGARLVPPGVSRRAADRRRLYRRTRLQRQLFAEARRNQRIDSGMDSPRVDRAAGSRRDPVRNRILSLGDGFRRQTHANRGRSVGHVPGLGGHGDVETSIFRKCDPHDPLHRDRRGLGKLRSSPRPASL
ncbi:MAG: hypothetical protein QM811_26670 [Pirellulales bacterium]